MRETIEIQGARENNLKDVSLEIPRDSLVVFTGVSGSGKSSLAFDTLYAEGQRRLGVDERSRPYARQFLDPDQEAPRSSRRRPLPGGLHRAEDRGQKPSLHRRHRSPRSTTTSACSGPTWAQAHCPDWCEPSPSPAAALADGRASSRRPEGPKIDPLAPPWRPQGDYKTSLAEPSRVQRDSAWIGSTARPRDLGDASTAASRSLARPAPWKDHPRRSLRAGDGAESPAPHRLLEHGRKTLATVLSSRLDRSVDIRREANALSEEAGACLQGATVASPPN